MVSDSATRPMERRLSAAGPSPVNSEDPTRLTSASPKPAGKNRLSIALIALAAVAIGIGAYFAFRSNPTPQPAPAVDTAAIAQTLETETVEIDNSAAEAAAAAEAERQRLAEQERQRQEEAERQRLAEQERQRQEEAERQRREEEQRRQEEAAAQRRREEARRNHKVAENLYLAVERSGEQYYFSQNDWNGLTSSQRNGYRKIGVVIKKDGQEFILALNHEPGEYTWNEAMSRFGNRLPTKQQVEAWRTQQEAVQRAVRAFGGNMPGPGDTYHSNVYNDNRYYNYWTRTEYDSSSAWYVLMYYGLVGGISKTYSLRVRAVAPVPVASAR